jgi:hypothetical protein
MDKINFPIFFKIMWAQRVTYFAFFLKNQEGSKIYNVIPNLKQ